MKILYVGTDGMMCGASYSMLKLIDELDKLGADIVPVVHHGNTEKTLSENGRFHYTVDAWSWSISLKYSKLKFAATALAKRILNIPCYFQYKKIIKKENPDLIHINALTTNTIALAALKCGKPIVWHIREMMEEDLNSRFWNYKEAHKLMKKANCFIAISKCVEEKYKKIVGPEKIKCIYNGVDTERFLNNEHRILTGPEIKITLAGRINRNKGQLLCLQGLIDVLKSNPNIILQFAGVGEDKDIKEITDLRDKEGLGEQVKLLGFVKDMEKLWSETDIAIVYSKFEAFGRVTVEAKMSGALVVGYNSGGTTELINDGEDGFLFENGYAPLGDVVKNIISDPEHAGIIADTGRRLSSQVFTSENNAKQIFELYKNILSEC